MHQYSLGSWKTIQRCILVGVLALLIISLAGSPRPTHALTGTVTDCSRFNDNAGTPNTLGELLNGGGTITFGCSGTITLPEGWQKEITGNYIINANGRSVAIQGNGNRVFHVSGISSLTLIGVTITGGSGEGIGGGAIYVAPGGTLILRDGAAIRNSSTPFDGAGIYNDQGTVTITNSIISGNTASSDGGGIYNFRGNLTITSSTLSGNKAVSGNGGGIGSWLGTLSVSNSTFSNNTASQEGGGIWNGTEVLNVTNSTFSGNRAISSVYGCGGGIANGVDDLNVIGSTFTNNSAGEEGGALCASSGSNTRVINSTLSGNSADKGGGIYLHEYDSTLKVYNSTLSSNSATAGGGIYIHPTVPGGMTVINSTLFGNSAGEGGGIYVYPVGSAGSMKNTIIANSSSDGNCSGEFTNGGNNLSSDGTCGFTLLNTDPKLGPLQNNGGATQTHLPMTGSPAIDAGNNTVCAAAPVSNKDQRGEIRPLDGNGDSTNICDIGAVEYRIIPPSLSINNKNGFESNTAKITFIVTRTGATDGVTSVQYATANGTATAGSDYIAASGTLTFAAGVTTRPIVVTLSGDAVVESNETFFVNLSSPTNASISDNQGTGLILNSTVRLTSPANNATTQDKTPTFSWQAVAGAAKYTLQMDDNSNFASPIINQTLTTTSYTQLTALADKPYYWRVRAQNAAGNVGGWDPRWSFTVNAVPMVQPTLIPTNTPRPTRTPRPTLIPTAAVVPTNIPTVTPTAIPTEVQPLLQVVESDLPVVHQSGMWTAYDEPSASSGRYLLSSTPADVLTMSFVGSELTVVYIQHPAVGSFAIEVDGMLMQTVNSVATEAVFGAEATISGLAYGQHIVKVYPVAGVVAIDAFRVESAVEVVVPTETPVPTYVPTDVPTQAPTETPVPTDIPTDVPTDVPTETAVPTETPTETATATPTEIPTQTSTATPTPSETPTDISTEEAPPPAATEEPAP